ncbi:PREDICTED: fractalkine isoform X2 [Chinchilla lanigera]|uniref:C-X3-C motif chemokine ligand 1 n=1 Tax=Chinchilla lanigera TaxID=34839 RepID=A0A8C2V871_CHILA|nr:PREDICTED: fractalkine isoform X2 [Chinchilla lanigera]
MAPTPLSWLLRLAVLCHLTVLLAGQQHGVAKCEIMCDKMTTRIPNSYLLRYHENRASCGKPAIILVTRRGKLFCADPKEQWVQLAIQYLNNQTHAPTTQSGGKFEKHVGKPATTPAALGMSQPALTEPEATGESSSLEPTASSHGTQRPTGTSPELPVRVTGSLGTAMSPTSKAQDGEPPAGAQLSSTAATSTTIAWQRSAPFQPGSSPGAQEKAPSTLAPSTPAAPTEPSSTQTPTTSHTTTEGQPVWTQGQTPGPESSVGPEEVGPDFTHPDASQDWGPSSMGHASVVPISSEGTPSQEPIVLGSLIPKAEEANHATVDPQRQVLITAVPDTQAATRRQAVGLLAFLGLLFCLGVSMFAYQSLQGCPRKMAGEMVEGLRYVPRSCGSNSYVLVPV